MAGGPEGEDRPVKARRRFLLLLGAALLAWVAFRREEGTTQRVLEYFPLIRSAAREAGLDPYLLAALVHVESSGRPGSGVPGGGVGLLQVTPGAASEAGGKKVDRKDLEPVAQGLRMGALYLARMKARFGDLRLALLAYRLGPTRVSREILASGGPKAYLARLWERPVGLYVSKVENLEALYRRLAPALAPKE